MQLTIFFTPTDATTVRLNSDDIYIVIDVIRATTSLTVIFEQGAKNVLVANTLEQAEQAKRLQPQRLLCGERNAVPLPGFDFGHSPAQFAHASLQGQELVMTTTNGTRAFFACPEQSTRLAGCFYNAHAVTSHALSLARTRDSDICIVCAGEAGYFALDDTATAGYLALELLRQAPEIVVHESVHAATAIYHAYTPPRLLEYCNSASKVAEAGRSEDLQYCVTIDASTAIPTVVGRDEQTGLLLLEKVS